MIILPPSLPPSCLYPYLSSLYLLCVHFLSSLLCLVFPYRSVLCTTFLHLLCLSHASFSLSVLSHPSASFCLVSISPRICFSPQAITFFCFSLSPSLPPPLSLSLSLCHICKSILSYLSAVSLSSVHFSFIPASVPQN